MTTNAGGLSFTMSSNTNCSAAESLCFRKVRTFFGFLLCAIPVVLITGCSDATTSVKREAPPITAVGQNLERFAPYAEGGCAFYTQDSNGDVRAFAVERKHLPFSVPAIQLDPTTKHGNGKVVRFHVNKPNSPPINLTCWVPNTLTTNDLVKIVSDSKGRRWSSIFSRFKEARVVPPGAFSQPISAEAAAFENQILAAAPNPAQNQMVPNGLTPSLPATRDNGCVEVEGHFYWNNDDGTEWVQINFYFEVCDSAGGDVFTWAIDNGYYDPAHVIVDANLYEITVLDSVTFTAEIVSSHHVNAVGWTWVPASGTSWDPYTQACAGNSLTCRIQVHGTGDMYYTIDDYDLGSEVSGQVRVIANMPDDVNPDADPTGDVELPDDWDSGGSSSTPVSFATSNAILANAIAQPDWVYTQGCAQCAGGPNTEPAVNVANYYGDCSDFVREVIHNVLGSSWPHQKISTHMFNAFTATQLAAHGYEEVDAFSVRAGDVVDHTTIDANGIVGSGHVGIFMGWAAGGFPIGWANNGRPATPTHINENYPVGRFNFHAASGYVTKFFRPQTTP